ncbi:MAG: Gfo/Idh/MocA family oxidoreductase [Dysgonamonadaceae bacterium]|jgi:predicted dehydrogenase|nr:Gfo/Idh/MocA family oxidoreductase [Dysgonamonadaceae bacterium]
MKKQYRWGILGAAKIAEKFAEGLKILPEAICYAVASRSIEKAETFRQAQGFEKAYGSYEEMLADPLVDIVYIATTNNLHFEHTMLALEAGKAVLCEKPFASNREQVLQMIAKAKEKNVFLMEALWSRFLPCMQELKQQIEQGAIGKPQLLEADFGFRVPFDPESRLFNPALGGGSVPDIGIYPLFLALYLFGKPVSVQVTSVVAPTGTDLTTAILLKHAGNEISVLTSSFAVHLDTEAKIFGETGSLHLCRMFHIPTKLMIRKEYDEEREIHVELYGNGYNYEAAEVMACLDRGEKESAAMSLAFSLDLIELLDEVVEKAV